MSKSVILTSLISVVLLATGCATSTIGPTAAGGNTFVVSREEGAFPSGNEPLLAEALQIATEHCKSLSKEMRLVDTWENSGAHTFGNYPKATVTYECV